MGSSGDKIKVAKIGSLKCSYRLTIGINLCKEAAATSEALFTSDAISSVNTPYSSSLLYATYTLHKRPSCNIKSLHILTILSEYSHSAIFIIAKMVNITEKIKELVTSPRPGA